jgi:hypothetical protein
MRQHRHKCRKTSGSSASTTWKWQVGEYQLTTIRQPIAQIINSSVELMSRHAVDEPDRYRNPAP